MRLKRKRIRELILMVLDHHPLLSDRQIVLGVQALARGIGQSAVLEQRRALCHSGAVRRSDRVGRLKNDRLVNLYEKRGGPSAKLPIPF